MANDNQTYTGWGAKQNPLIYYFKGLALNELGKKQEATELFNKMIETGNNQVNMIYHEALQDKSVKIQQAHKLTKAEGYLYLALANVGLGNGLKAKEFNTKALEIVPGLYDVKTCESAI